MPAATFVSVEEYLSNPEYERCEYEAGVVTEKPRPDWVHGELCLWIGHLLLLYFPQFRHGTEVRSRLKEFRWRLPDITVEPLSLARERYAYSPNYLNIEILSEDDTKEKMFEKCRLYHEWGVPYCWVIDAKERCAWEYHCNEAPREAFRELRAGEIKLSIEEMFSRL